MDRSTFLKSLFMVVAAPKMLAELNLPVDKKSFTEASRGILWHIENQPVYTIDYTNNFTIGDFHRLVAAFDKDYHVANKPEYDFIR